MARKSNPRGSKSDKKSVDHASLVNPQAIELVAKSSAAKSVAKAPVALGIKSTPLEANASAKTKEEKSQALHSKKVVTSSETSEKAGPKKVSEALLKTIERRKAAQQSDGQQKNKAFGRPPMRRGRRPKRPVEYTPTHTDEDNYGSENEVEGIEYDTGIRFKEKNDADGFNLDRFEDFDEELNFDR